MSITNYWFQLIWLLTVGMVLAISLPKKQEIVMGRIEERWQIAPAVLLVVPYILAATLRSDNFGDTYAYRSVFREAPSKIAALPLYLEGIKKDKGFSVLIVIIKALIGNSPILFFMFIATVQMLCMAFIYRKYSENYWMSIFVFVAGTDYMSWCHNGILIDDGSSDSSYSICKEYEEKDTRMRCFTQKNHGVSYTRNKGISLARGKFIAFLDADDFIPPNYLYELVKCCEIGDVAICDTVFLDEKAVKFRFTVGKTVLTRTDAINALLIRKSINSGPAGKLYKKELIANLKFPSIKTYEDILFTLDALLNANKIVTTDRTQYFYVENNNGAMSKMIKNPSLDIIIATERLLQVIAQRKDLKPECCYVTVSHLFQYVIGLFQENNYRNSEFVDGTRKLFRKYMCLILTCRAIPWKEKLVFFLFGQGIFLQNGKRIHWIRKE